MKIKWILPVILVSTIFNVAMVNAEDDSQIIDNLIDEKAKELKTDFKMETFKTCSAVNDVMKKYINKSSYNRPPIYLFNRGDDIMMDESVSSVSEWKGASEDFSDTNTQVSWVDESEIIKTDWEYVYYYNESKKWVFILKKDWEELNLIKKINIPEKFWGVQLYIENNKLVILGNWYSDTTYNNFYYFNRANKSYTIVYDIEDKEKIKLERLNINDWNLSNSRKIWDKLYVLSTGNYSYYYPNDGKAQALEAKDAFMPKQIDISKTDVESEQNLKIKNKEYPYKSVSGNVVDCDEINYVLPDEDTLDDYSFNPSYTTITAINLSNSKEKVKNTIIMWDIREVYMSLDNLYITSGMYTNSSFYCPIYARCIMPWYPQGQNTVIHKMAIDGLNLEYKNSNIVEWMPLTQYSMDEHNWDFRIITQNTWEETSTNLFILNENLDLEWSLTNLAPKESFKSSRFMWDKLYLVTFEQIDPLFVIDVSNSKKPEILWELKIPGYSTYLHPYDENHLIGLGYNTSENESGWVYNDWLKVDLYDISDFKNPKQKYSLTLWERGSYSEALTNPRMFVWNSKEKNLLLPARLQTNEKDDMYQLKDYFNWVVSIKVDDKSGIKELWRITHVNTNGLEEKRDEDCEDYLSKIKKEEECKILLNGEQYCQKSYTYVPNYCYADSTISQYISAKSWEFRDNFINRVLYIGDSIISVSDAKATLNDSKNFKEDSSVDFK